MLSHELRGHEQLWLRVHVCLSLLCVTAHGGVSVEEEKTHTRRISVEEEKTHTQRISVEEEKTHTRLISSSPEIAQCSDV